MLLWVAVVAMMPINGHSFAHTMRPAGFANIQQSPFTYIPSPNSRRHYYRQMAKSADDDDDDVGKKEILGPLASVVVEPADTTEAPESGMAATRTVNERLQAELEEMKRKELYGSKTSIGQKMGLASFASTKTDEERNASIEEAKDLNGVNPAVALGGGVFALVAATGLWILTSFLAEEFVLHPVETDIYFVQRVASVFRNVVMGLTSLASGFFGVCGFGLLLLGFRVAYGVAKGELDPTPIKSKKQEIEMPNVWDLMTSQKGRRGRRD